MSETNKDTALTVAQKLDAEYPIDKYNRVFPTTSILNSVIPYHQVSIDILQLSPNPENGEVFKLASKKNAKNEWEDVLSLTKLSLEKIANLLKVEWLPGESGRVDDRKDPRIIEFTAVGRIRNLGSLKKDDYTILSATKQVDLNAIENEQRFLLEEKAADGKLYYKNNKMNPDSPECAHAIERLVKKRMIEVDKHKLALAESGAKTRAIRGFGIKSTYSKEQLDRPFAVHNIYIDHDAINNDPEAKKLLMSSAFGAENLLFPTNNNDSKIEDAEIVDESQKDEIVDTKTGEVVDTETNTETNVPDAETQRSIKEDEFKTLDVEGRWKVMESLIGSRTLIHNDNPVIITKAIFVGKDDKAQMKNLMWAYDQPLKDNLPY